MAVKVKNLILGEGRPKICVPLTPNGEEELKKQLNNIKKLCFAEKEACVDMLEWRVDFWEETDWEKDKENALQRIKEAFPEMPLLITFRTKKEGGERELSGENYGKLCSWAMEGKRADLLDIELFGEQKMVEHLIKRAKKAGILVVLSSHDFEKTPSKEEMKNRLLTMERLGADILKLAVMPAGEEDVLALLQVTQEMKGLTDKPVITMSMGKLGLVSRLTGGVFGSAVTFGTAGKASAPGQLEATKLLEFLKTFQ